ncbi:hypothetical protein KNN17_16505 [Arthrobacter bambusae]|uniref:TY-Chap domain-containing protein n=1 Tax=Arthrobacter TaxID=1663 RepID=UPI001116C081|nr:MULTISPECIES: hypothetical protein [Arthrobacter]MCI0143168.1 hypothetical protein [Arthrobacter bambusae]
MEEIESSLDEVPADPRKTTGQAVRSFLAGDPLLTIASAANLRSYKTLDLLSSRVADRAEAERTRSLRMRCNSTSKALLNEERLIGRLKNSGIAPSEIPIVLVALGKQLDIDIAVALLRKPGMLADASLRHDLDAPPAKVTFSGAEYREAAAAFMNDYHHFGSPKDVASYDSWVIAETWARRERPSVIAIRRYFGAWESVIGAVQPPEIEGEFDGIVRALKDAHVVQERWARAGEQVSEVLANMQWNSFLSIDYGDNADGPNRPYAQASLSADGVWCEIVSAEFLPGEQWPIDADYLLRNGWSPPDENVPNWYLQAVPPLEAGHQILEGLRYGRQCDDAEKIRLA